MVDFNLSVRKFQGLKLLVIFVIGNSVGNQCICYRKQCRKFQCQEIFVIGNSVFVSHFVCILISIGKQCIQFWSLLHFVLSILYLSEIVDIEILLSVHGGLFFLGHCNCHFNLIIQVLCILNFRQCKKGHLYVDMSKQIAHINIKVAFLHCLKLRMHKT